MGLHRCAQLGDEVSQRMMLDVRQEEALVYSTGSKLELARKNLRSFFGQGFEVVVGASTMMTFFAHSAATVSRCSMVIPA